MRRHIRVVVVLVASMCGPAALVQAQSPPQSPQQPGILLLAHGGAKEWNDRIAALAVEIDRRQPVEVALGMASRASMQAAVDKLVQRGVTSIVAVPLFISSHSSVITSTEYLLGARQEAPLELAAFAKMNHAGGAADHAAHAAADGATPVTSTVPIRVTPALDSHPIVGDILARRALAISKEPAREAVVIVAHGPTKDDENRKWLDDMARLAAAVGQRAPFRSIDYMTVRDDAPAPVRDAATADLRALVQRRTREGSRVLIVNLLMSYGGIEAGIRKRLEGLDYVMAPQGLAPDARLAEWVLEMAEAQR